MTGLEGQCKMGWPDTYGQSDKITSESKAFQIFTFRYRNFSLHNGYYWDSESIAKMMRVINLTDGISGWIRLLRMKI